MANATRFTPDLPNAPSAVASPLAAIRMNPHERRQAEHDMRTAQALVDFAFVVAGGWQALVRHVRGIAELRLD
jgi:hypothetical protein